MSNLMTLVKKQPSVLMVDDDPEDIYLTQRAFSGTSWEGRFDSVSNADDACTLLGLREQDSAAESHQSSTIPSLIILDLNMPEINGFDMLARIRASARLKCIPVIVFTTSCEQQDVEKAYALGANSFISKPHSSFGMSRLAERFLFYWFSLNRGPVL